MYDTIKKYWNSDEYVLGLKTNYPSKAKPKTIIILTILLLYGYLLLFNGYLYPTDFLTNLINWPDRNIISGSFVHGIVLLAHVGIAFLSLIHFVLIMVEWFKAIKNANKK
jgi:hypothetical protein